jgi:hypothetical protein
LRQHELVSAGHRSTTPQNNNERDGTTAMNHSDAEPSLESLIERSAELKRALVDFAGAPQFERHLMPFMLEAAGPEGELDDSEAVGIIDRFALQYRLPNGKTVLDQFLASRSDLSAADRDMVRGWHDPVEGLFEIRSKDQTAIVLRFSNQPGRRRHSRRHLRRHRRPQLL